MKGGLVYIILAQILKELISLNILLEENLINVKKFIVVNR